MTRVGVQLYSLRDTPGTLPDLLDAVGDTAFQGVEFAHRYADSSATDVAAVLEANDLAALGAHVGFEAMESTPAELREAYDPVECSRFVLPHVPPATVGTAADVDALATRLNEVAQTLSSVDATFCYHNQAHDFTTVEGEPAFDRLVANTDDSVGFELDVGGAVTAGVDPVELIERYGDRIPLVHVKDVVASDPAPDAAQECVPIGTGDVDIEAVAAAAAEANVEWLIYENDEPDDPVEALERGAATMAALQT